MVNKLLIKYAPQGQALLSDFSSITSIKQAQITGQATLVDDYANSKDDENYSYM